MAERRRPAGVPRHGRQPTTAELRACIEARDLEGLLALLEESGRVPTARQAHRLAFQILEDEPHTLYAWGVEMAGRPEITARLPAAWFLSPFYAPQARRRRDEVQQLLLQLADDDSWVVREGAAGGFGQVLQAHFDAVYPLYEAWTRHPSENVRRAVVLAVMPVVRDPAHGVARAPACLRLLEPLLADRSAYVRKNLGPFAIGAAILNHHPDLTFATLAEWRDRYQDEQVRWNLAMACSASGGVAHVERALAFLHTLADDPHPTVWRAVASAARALGKKRPEVVKPELQRWRQDETRRKAAETALKYLK